MGATITFRPHSDAPLLCILAVLAPVLAVLTPLQIWIPAICVAGAILLRRLVARESWQLACPRAALVMLLIVGWGAATSFWSIFPERSLEISLRLVLVAAALVVLLDAAMKLDPAGQARVGRWLILGGCAMLVLTLGRFLVIKITTEWVWQQTLLGNELAGLNRTASIIAIFAWPVTMAIWQHNGRRLAIVFVLLSALTISLLSPFTPQLALLLGALVFVISLFTPFAGRAIVIAGFVLFLVLLALLDSFTPWANALLLAHIDTPNSEIHRFVIWDFAISHIFERPVFGWGLDASRAIPGGGQSVFLFANPDGTPATGAALPLHPHNMVLQIWLELGFIGFTLASALVAGILRYATKIARNPGAGAVILATLVSGFVIAQLGFGVWQGWWLGTLGIAAVLALSMTRPAQT